MDSSWLEKSKLDRRRSKLHIYSNVIIHRGVFQVRIAVLSLQFHCLQQKCVKDSAPKTSILWQLHSRLHM